MIIIIIIIFIIIIIRIVPTLTINYSLVNWIELVCFYCIRFPLWLLSCHSPPSNITNTSTQSYLLILSSIMIILKLILVEREINLYFISLICFTVHQRPWMNEPNEWMYEWMNEWHDTRCICFVSRSIYTSIAWTPHN